MITYHFFRSTNNFCMISIIEAYMENESDWVVNGIITISLVSILVPLVAPFVEKLDSLLLIIAIMYVIYTILSGEAIDPPRPK